jgi:hypothetical protein
LADKAIAPNNVKIVSELKVIITVYGEFVLTLSTPPTMVTFGVVVARKVIKKKTLDRT